MSLSKYQSATSDTRLPGGSLDHSQFGVVVEEVEFCPVLLGGEAAEGFDVVQVSLADEEVVRIRECCASAI
jgi:hypothetical protein